MRVLLVLLLLVAGCSGANGSARPKVGKSTQTIRLDGRKRTFHLYRPASLPSSAPLVVMLHGGFGNGEQAERSYGWDAEADKGRFLVAYPDGVDRAWATGGGCCGIPGRRHVDDVAFIQSVVATIGRELPLDRRRVYATGISNGGMLSYRLACDTKTFAAIGPDSATLLGPCPTPAPISVIHVHGTEDHNIPYNGGKGGGVAEIDGPAVPGLVAGWRKTGHCAAPVTTVHAPVTTSAATCPGGRAVELITIAGAGHQWPGGVSKPVLERVMRLDPPSKALDATDVIWKFFAAHPG